MLLQGHYLQHVVAQTLHPGQHRTAEILESGDSLRLPAHPYMAFIYKWMRTRAGRGMFPFVGRGVPHLGAEDRGDLVLHHPGGVSRYSLSASSGPFHPEFVERAVREEKRGEPEFPVAFAHRLEGISGSALPVVAVADEIDAGGVRGPFP